MSRLDVRYETQSGSCYRAIVDAATGVGTLVRDSSVPTADTGETVIGMAGQFVGGRLPGIHDSIAFERADGSGTLLSTPVVFIASEQVMPRVDPEM